MVFVVFLILNQNEWEISDQIKLLHEAKEISGLLRGIGQRSEFDDELPASTWKEKAPPWKKRDRSTKP